MKKLFNYCVFVGAYAFLGACFSAVVAEPFAWALTLEKNNNTITDGTNWTIKVDVNQNTKVVTLNSTVSALLSSEVLDLGDAVATLGNDEYIINQVAGKFYGNSVVKPSVIILPKTTETIGSEAFKQAALLDANPRLTKFYIESTCLTNIASSVFNNGGAPEDTTIIAPNLKTIGNSAFWRSVTSANQPAITNDVSLVIPSSVTVISAAAFAGQTNMCGHLVLTNLTVLEGGAFNCKQRMTDFESIYVASANITALDSNTFNSNAKAKKIVIDFPLLATIGECCFERIEACEELVIGARKLGAIHDNAAWISNSALTNLVMTGYCPDDTTTSVDYLVKTVKTDYKCRLTVDRRTEFGWKAVSRACTEAELARADYPESGCFGVYETSSGRKLWMVHADSTWYKPKGFVIVIQ